MNQRKRLTFELALSGISAALALVGIVLYYYSPFAKLSFLVLSAVALLLPLCVQSVRGCALAYLAAGGLGIAVVGPIACLPFLFLFGWQPVAMGFGLRFLTKKTYISIPTKAILFNAGLYGTYALYGLGTTVSNALARLNWEPSYWLIALLGTLLWIGYDYLMQWVYRWLDKRLAKVTAKYLPSPKASAPQRGESSPPETVDDDPYFAAPPQDKQADLPSDDDDKDCI